MTDRGGSSGAQTVAALARLEEQVRTLQRERREDRARWREDMDRFHAMLSESRAAMAVDIAEALTPIVKDLAAAKVTAYANDRWISTVKAQGAVWAVVISAAGALLMWMAGHVVEWFSQRGGQ